MQSHGSYKAELKTHASFNRASVMALGKNVPQTAQSDNIYYLLITFLFTRWRI